MPVSDNNFHLFDTFNPATAADWQLQILNDIKAATAAEKKAWYEQRMVWQTYEGIAVQPFYTATDIEGKAVFFPEKKHYSWQNRETISYTNEKEVNNLATEAISSGAQAIAFNLMETEVAAVNFSKLIQHIKPAETPVSFLIRDLPKNLISIVQNIYPYRWKGSLQYDPIATYQTQDKPVTPEAYNILADAIIQTAQFPEFYVLTASSHHLHEAGASAVQELAFLIASFVEYAHQLTERKVPVANIFSTAQFSVAVSTSYFTEIAKCRALRLLLAQLAGAYGINNYQAYIHVQTALWNKPSADAYNNIIRTTIEAMAAVAGGCDALTIAPYTVAFQKNSAFARRIARNISTILKEESYFDKVLNIASGAYYIEHLTHTFAQEAWQLFQTIERQGGIMQAFQSGFMNDSIKKVRLQREADLKSGKQVLVGVNKYKIQDEPAAPKEYFKKLYQK